jgi:K+-transporting ATPase ATPase C chain
LTRTDEAGPYEVYRPVVLLALLSILICGLLFPLVVTGLSQAALPYQANGDIIQFQGRSVGSVLIAQNFTQPIFFHARNDSASGVDPDITLQDALAQVPRIHNATGISSDALTLLVTEHEEGTFWVFGSPYVNVLELNLALIQSYPATYSQFS